MDRLKPALQEVRQRFPDRVFVLCARMPREMADEFTAMGFLIFEDPTRAIAAVAALARLAQGFAKPRAALCRSSAAQRRFPPGRSTRPRRSACSARPAFRSRRRRSRVTRDEAVAAAKASAFRSC